MVKMVFSCRFPKDKNDADFSKNILQMQEKVEPDLFCRFSYSSYIPCCK